MAAGLPTPSFIKAFSYGIKRNIAPNLASPGSSIECTNIDLSKGALVPFNSPVKKQDVEGSQVLEFKGNITGHDTQQVVTMLNKAFVATAHGVKKTSDGKEFTNIAIEAPLKAIEVTPGPLNQAPTQSINLQPDTNRLSWTNNTNKEVLCKLHLQAFIDETLNKTIKSLWLRGATTADQPELPYRTTTLYIDIFIGPPSGQQEHIIATSNVPTTMQWTTPKSYTGKNTNPTLAIDRSIRLSYGESVNEVIYENTPVANTIEFTLLPNYAVYIHLASRTQNNNGEVLFTADSSLQVNYGDAAVQALFKAPPLLEVFTLPTATLFGKLAAKDYRWCYTYYNSNDGTESAPSPYTRPTTIGMLQSSGALTYSYATLGNIKASDDPQVTNIKVYRMGDGVSKFSLLEVLPNEDSVIIDNKHTAQQGSNLTTIGYNKPKPFKCISVQDGVLVGAYENMLFYSDPYSPLSWNPLNYVLFDDDITGIGSTTSGLIVFTAYKTYILANIGKNSLFRQLLYSTLGCISTNSVQVVGGICVWQAHDGIYAYAGGTLRNLTKQAIGDLGATITSSTATHDCYYGLLGDKILAINFSLNYAAYFIEAKGATGISIISNTLCYTNGKALYSYTGAPMPINWKSTWLQNFLTLVKNYKNVVVYAEGELEYKIYIGNTLAASGKLTTGINDIKVSQQHRLGYYIMIEFTGVGTVYEIQFLTEERQNAR